MRGVTPRRVLSVLTRVEALVAVAAYATVACLLLADVFSREFLSQSIWGGQKVAVLCSILAGMLGLTLATGQGAHFRPEFTDGLLRVSWIVRLGDVISAVLFASFAVYAIQFVLQSQEFQDRVAVVNVLLWPFQIIVPYALLSSALKHAVFATWPDIKREMKAVT